MGSLSVGTLPDCCATNRRALRWCIQLNIVRAMLWVLLSILESSFTELSKEGVSCHIWSVFLGWLVWWTMLHGGFDVHCHMSCFYAAKL